MRSSAWKSACKVRYCSSAASCPAANASSAPAGSVSYANATGGQIAPGVTVSSTVNPAGQPGLNFNNPNLPLGNNVVVAPNIVGTQGLTDLGVGRVSPTSGIGGFVFSAQSDFFNLLVRALKSQGRIDILSRPQVMTLDQQQARVFVGQNFPIILGSNVTATGVISNNVSYTPVGVQLVITPRITPDGRVVMRVTPEVSSTTPTNVSLGNGVTATAINQQIVDTTVVSMDGETVALGGMISRSDTKNENKVPWLGDLPYLGTLFRYRTQVKAKVELLVILTPHVVRNRMEADRVLAEESARMDWMLDDVTRTQGLYGMAPVLHPKAFAAPVGPGGVVDGSLPSPLLAPVGPVVAAGDVRPARGRPWRRRRGRRSSSRRRRARPAGRRPGGRPCRRSGAAGRGRGPDAGTAAGHRRRAGDGVPAPPRRRDAKQGKAQWMSSGGIHAAEGERRGSSLAVPRRGNQPEAASEVAHATEREHEQDVSRRGFGPFAALLLLLLGGCVGMDENAMNCSRPAAARQAEPGGGDLAARRAVHARPGQRRRRKADPVRPRLSVYLGP